jgi:hypothetical protein
MRHAHVNHRFFTATVFASAILFVATSAFAQKPERPVSPDKPHSKAVPPLHAAAAAPARPMAHPELFVEQLKKIGAEKKARWERLLRTALDLAVNLLSGNETNLLSGNRPELLSKNKTALLSGNSPELLSKNNPKLISENKAQILSGNNASLFSGNRISLFSGFKIEIHIENTGNNSGNHAPAAGPNPGRPMRPASTFQELQPTTPGPTAR